MRNAFARAVQSAACENNRVVLLSGDIGNRMFDSYKSRFPKRFYNCGVAEANMIGLAAGLAMTGFRPVTYTIASFATARCLEQIRIDLCYHRQPVLVVGTGAGLAYAALGATHTACEDVAMMRVLPEMTVICPGDPMEVPGAVRAALVHDGPVYLRLGKKGETCVHDRPPEIQIGRSITVRAGHDVALLANGVALPASCEAADELARQGISARVDSFHTVKPLDTHSLEDVFSRYQAVVTIEEHSRLGGFGSAIAEWALERAAPLSQFRCVGTADRYVHGATSAKRAREQHGIAVRDIVQSVRSVLNDDAPFHL